MEKQPLTCQTQAFSQEVIIEFCYRVCCTQHVPHDTHLVKSLAWHTVLKSILVTKLSSLVIWGMWRVTEQTGERMGERKRKYTRKRAVDQTIKYTTNLRGNSPGTLKQHAVLGVSQILARGLQFLHCAPWVTGKIVLLSTPAPISFSGFSRIQYTVNNYSTNKSKK